MKILEVLTYYRPWVSGLTMYVEWLSKALVEQGHDVTVLTSQYDPSLPRYDVLYGVKIVRVPVVLRISKGVIMPGFGPMAWKLTQQADVIHLHLPQFDAPGVALRGRLLGKPVILTYHCDLQLPQGKFNQIVNRVVLFMNQLAGKLSDAVVTYTLDYATHSSYLSQFIDRKLYIIPPPVELAPSTQNDDRKFREKHQLDGRKVIGISARLATEKGVEVLLKALPIILESHPNAIVLHAGMYQNVLGEEAYAKKLVPLFERYKYNYYLLGNLGGADYSAFLKNLDCLVIPSLNSTESFGLVQIESMINGVPVSACDLPGVRQPVTMTGMGEITPVGDHKSLATAVIQILNNKEVYIRSSGLIADVFSSDNTANIYAKLFTDLKTTGNAFYQPTYEPAAYDRLREMCKLYKPS